MSNEQEHEGLPDSNKLEARVVLLGETIVACNKPATKLLLSPREEILGQSFLSFSVAEQSRSRPPAVALRLRAVAALAGQSQKFQWILKKSDGSVVRVWIIMQDHRIQGKDFVQLKLYPQVRSIEPDETTPLVKMGLERSDDAVFITDADGQILYINHAFEKIYGYSAQEAIGNTPRILKSGLWSHEMYREFWRSLLNKENVATEITNRTKDGRLLQIEASTNAILDNFGNLIGFLAIHREATIRKAFTEILEESDSTAANRSRNRIRQTSLAAQFSKHIVTATDISELYQLVVDWVQNQFDYYHTQLLRYEPVSNSVVLAAGYGEVGKEMVEVGYEIPLGTSSIGKAAESGESILQPDLITDSNRIANRFLPDTKGELAVPILLGDEILGVLDVLSSEANVLDLTDQIILEGITAQLAVTIESIRRRQEIELSPDELGQLERNINHERWQHFHSNNDVPKKNYRFGSASSIELNPGTSKDSLASKSNIGERESLTTVEEQVLSTQMKVRGRIIGALGVHDDPDKPLSDEDRELLDSITVQVAEALDKARLLEETQKRALDMESVVEISAAISSILDFDKILDTMTDLTKRHFKLYHVAIYLLEDSWLRQAASTSINSAVENGEFDIEVNLHDPTSPLASAARTSQSVAINDSAFDSAYKIDSFLSAGHSELVIPLMAGEEILGVMRLIAEKTDRFFEEEVQIHTILGSQVSVALQNAKIYAKQLETTEKLLEVDRLKSQFIARMSHELRTPLNSIIGFADVLLEGIDGPLTDPMKEDASLIRESGKHMMSLIDEMLVMSKTANVVIELQYEEIHAPSFSEDIIANAQALAKGKDLEFNLVLDPGLDTFQADRTRLTQIFLNLLSNAIKFTDSGTITLRMEKENGGLQATVIDTGIGIYDEDTPKMFEQFRRVDDTLTTITGGNGLGLTISRSLVDLHGGELLVKSIPGEGSAFRFTIPGKVNNLARIDA